MDVLTDFQNEESELALLDPQDFPIESGESVLTILEDFGAHNDLGQFELEKTILISADQEFSCERNQTREFS